MPQPLTIRFDGWTLHRNVGELVRGEEKVRLQDQPLQVLNELLEFPGELVTREQLIARLWPKGVVDYDTGINSAVRKLRVALQDTGDTPRYIETVPRKGYRFIGRIDAEVSPTVATPVPIAPTPPMLPPAPRVRRHSFIYVLGGLLAVAVVGFLIWRKPASTTDGVRPVTVTTPTANPQKNERALAILPLKSASGEEEAKLLASSVSDLLRDRLARFAELTVISNRSAANLGEVVGDVQAAGRKLHAQFVVHGNIERQGDRLQIALLLTDTQTGKQLWADNFERPVSDLAAVREETAAHVARVLHLPAGARAPASPINLEAYQLYVRGQELMSKMRLADAEQAGTMFRRATVLDPGFARAYLANGQALVLAQLIATSDTPPELVARVEKLYERALQLDPTLGEVWIERARLLQDNARAEELYRKGLALSPNYGVGYMRYSELLMSQGRNGEAIEMIDRARHIDPMTPQLHARKGFLLFVQHGDVAGAEALMREALEIDPDFQIALLSLADSRYRWSGEFAEGVSLAERAIALNPDDDSARTTAAMMYLDLDDPQAAEHVLHGVRARSDADVDLAKYRRDVRRAAGIAYGLSDDDDFDSGPYAPLAEAICDAAVQSGDFARAVVWLESKYASGESSLPRRRGVSIAYAVTLKFAGDAERSGRVARSLLATLEAEGVGRPKNWFGREQAAIFAVLGDDAKAMELLEDSQRMRHFARWWYTGEIDPLYEHLHADPRFKALAARAKEHRAQQRALLEEMRNKGVVPRRTG